MQRFINNFSTQLAGPLATASAVALIPAADAARLVGLGTSDYYLLTLAAIGADGSETAHEIVKVTANAAGSLTIERAKEGTVAAEWPINTPMEARYTAGAAAELSAHKLAADPHPQYATPAEAADAAPVQSVNSRTGAVVVAEVPAGGTTGQVLTKRAAGYGWEPAPGGSGTGGGAGEWAVRSPDTAVLVGVGGCTTHSEATVIANRLYLFPFRVGEETPVTQLLQRLADPGAGNLSVGLYANDTETDPLRDRPGALIFGGTVSTVGIPAYDARFPAVADGVVRATLQPGSTYWMAAGHDNAQFVKMQAVASILPTLGFDVNGVPCTYMYTDIVPLSVPASLAGYALTRHNLTATRLVAGLIRP